VFKARGVLKGDTSGTVNNIQYKDGILTGDIGLIMLVEVHAGIHQERGYIPVFNYVPEGPTFVKDATAVFLILHELCEKLQFAGEIPAIPEVQEGMDY
jgi:hypothetical protein